MASSVGRLRVEDPPPTGRSPEREALAEAVERHREASQRLQRLRAALGQARRDSTDRFIAAESAERELNEAKRREPHRRAAELLGEVAPSGVSAAEAQRALTEARVAYDEVKDVAGVLEAEIGGIGGAEFHVASMQSGVERALAAVIAVDPALGELVAAFDAARAEVAALSAVLRFLGLTRLPRNLQTWDVVNRPLPPRPPLVPMWKDAIDALLRGEVDASQPGSPVPRRW
jgi:hypothetical protein